MLLKLFNNKKTVFMKKAIFIAATGQNVGKTTLCLGILAALHKRLTSVGFIKPVGQQHVKLTDNLIVDKDVILFKEYFALESDYTDMSPVILPTGFTRDFLDHKVHAVSLELSIQKAFNKISQQHDFTLVEGTGHIGVGSIVSMNNAKVAALLGLDMIIIASGGLGSAYDELSLNISMCQAYGVKVKGIILNRVLMEKRSMIEEYFPKALKSWNIPLLGCVPYNAFLSSPTLKDFEILFQTQLIAGHKHHLCHFQHPRLVAGSLEAFQDDMQPNELIITPATREDIILETLNRQQQVKEMHHNPCQYGIILTGRHPPSSSIIEQIKQGDLPCLYAPLCSYDAMKMITTFTAKIRGDDLPKIEQAIELVEQSLNFDLLLEDWTAQVPSLTH
jgi:phosphate acetyltransferase